MSFHSYDQEKFDRWKAALSRAHRQAGWNQYDADVRQLVSAFDRFNAVKGGYVPPRWELMKALLWVEGGGPGQKIAWAHMPMQIGVAGDPGIIDVITSPRVALVTPPELRRNFDAGTIRSNPVVNIAAGMTLLHLKMAFFGKRPKAAVPPPQAAAGAGKGAAGLPAAAAGAAQKTAGQPATKAPVPHGHGHAHTAHGHAGHAHAGHAHTGHPHPATEPYVSGWRPFNPITLYQQYNVGDGAYAAKLRFCMELILADSEPTEAGSHR